MKSSNSDFIELGRKQASLFHQNNVTYIECLVKFDSMRHALNLAYGSLIGWKMLPEVKTLPHPEKVKLWEQTKEFAAGRMNAKDLKELSIALYTLEYYLQ